MAATRSLVTSAELDTRLIPPGVEVTPSLALPEEKQRELLVFATSSVRVDSHSIGWLTTTAYIGAHNQGRMIACYNNSDLVGYIIWGRSNGTMRCYVVWVRNDARLLVHGRALVLAIEHQGRRMHCSRIDLWCATDLPANLFWRALGFEKKAWRWGRGNSRRRHWLWRRAIAEHQPPQPTGEPQPLLALYRPSPPAPRPLA